MNSDVPNFEELKRFDTIFVDFFDTIVHRSIPPESVKVAASKRLAYLLGASKDIYKLRATLERSLCERNNERYGELDFCFDELADAMHVELASSSQSVSEFRKIMIDTELETESACQFLNSSMVSLLQQAKHAGKRIVLLSDFYFNEAMFHHMLAHHGIDGLFTDVFVSGAERATKRSGRLYDLAIKKLSVPNNQVCMIGDNDIADQAAPRKYSITPLPVNSTDYYAYYNHFSQLSFDEILVRFDSLYRPEQRSHFSAIAVTLLLYIARLHDAAKRDGFETVLFLSREGEFLKKIFDVYRTSINSPIRSEYFMTSRRATFLPSLGTIEAESFETLFRQYRRISPKEFLLNLNFTEEQIASFSIKTLDQREADLPTSDVYKSLLAHPHFVGTYENNRQTQLAGLTRYLDQLRNGKLRVALADVGWKGTIQDNLARTFPHIQFTGYYLGLNLPGSNLANSQKYGLLFDTQTAWDKRKRESTYNECTSLFEVLLGASHGSVREYNADGSWQTIENDIERNLFTSWTYPLQQELERYIRLTCQICAILNTNTSESLSSLSYKRFSRFIFSPNKNQTSIYTNLTHVESFGVHEITRFRPSGVSRLRSLWQFISNPKRYLRNAFWPAQKLVANGLSHVTPLYRIYRTSRHSP